MQALFNDADFWNDKPNFVSERGKKNLRIFNKFF